MSGTRNDSEKLLGLLAASYHPRNEYFVHMELKASEEERSFLRQEIESHPLYSTVGNVHMAARPFRVTYKGPSMLSAYLFGMANLLELRSDFDWFINLSASDYPVMTQDGENVVPHFVAGMSLMTVNSLIYFVIGVNAKSIF